MKKENWIWMPHSGHFICGERCLFRLNTYVGKFIVSTIGELMLMYNSTDNKYYENIGNGRKFETMVFKARKSEHKCCPYEIIVEKEVDFEGYNDAGQAYDGHLKLCKKWSRK